MPVAAQYNDGQISRVRHVDCDVEAGALLIRDSDSNESLDSWPAGDVFPVHGRKSELRIGCTGKPNGARLIFTGAGDVQRARDLLPALHHKHRMETGRQIRIMAASTVALVSVIAAYLYGVPLLASQIVKVVPPEWEMQLGNAAVAQIENALKEEAGFEVCDPDPNSLANRAIARFAAEAVEGTGTPFVPDIKVIRTTIPNAFALPGGHSYYFSALLKETQTADEFAGVMAHELGHVVYRHGMEQLIATSATGLLIGFILGDMTGISVAGAVGAALIDSSFSRDAERQADRFAADVARRMAFQPAAMPRLLQRISADDEMSRALALFSTHPLTAEREAALAAMTVTDATLKPPFTPEEWQAIKTMCGPL
jgi:Zn-dependent protease with chaperone function